MTLEQIEEAVAELEPADLKRFSMWFDAFQERRWDDQIAADQKGAKLKALADDARRDFKRGAAKPL